MNTNRDIITSAEPATIGQLANSYASQNVFSDYHERIAANTKRRQKDDLLLFAQYLNLAGMATVGERLYSDVETWQGITFGLVDGFVRWMLTKGYAVDSINVRLSTVKVYCKLSAKAGMIDASEYALIKLVTGYRHKEKRNVDLNREVTRVGDKKAEAIVLSKAQADALKSQPDTAQGRRDALLMCLLLEHGLRCGEVEALTVQSINLDEETLTFYREKVNIETTHELTKDTRIAARRYIESEKPTSMLLLGSRKGGALQGVMSDRAITDRVRVLGERIGIVGLSAHDCRHYWATSAIKGGTDIKSLQDAGGWSSPAMPLRYAASGKIANKGVKLG